MIWPAPTQITNMVQTIALMALSGLLGSGTIPAETVNVLASGLGAAALLIYNAFNHTTALKAPAPDDAPPAKK